MVVRGIAVAVLLVALTASVIYSLILLEGSRTTENYILFGATGILTVVVYMTTLLGFRITGGNVAVERTKNEVYAAKADIVEIGNMMAKMSAIVADGSGRWGGFPEEHQAKIDEYIRGLRVWVSKDIDKQVAEDVGAVRALVQARIDAQNRENT